MLLKVFGVAQIIIQVISAQILASDFVSQNVLKDLANSPLAGYGRSRRQTNNPPVGLSVIGELPRNGLANGSPFGNGIPFGNFPRGNGLPYNFALNNDLPNNSPISSLNFPCTNTNALPQNRLLSNVNGINNNGLPLNNNPNVLPGVSNMPNGLPGLSNVPNGLPGLTDVPNGLPGINSAANRLPGLNNVLNGLPGLNNVPTELPNLNNLPVTNEYQNWINVPAGNNILNLNNLPAANTVPKPTGLPNFNNVPCGDALPSFPVSNRWPLNNLPNGNMLPSINNILPFLNNFRITEIGIGHGVADINRFPRNSKPDSNVPTKVYYSQNGNGLAQQVSDGFPEIKIYQRNNVFPDIKNAPSASALPSIVPVDIGFSSVNYFAMNNGVSSEAQNTLPNNGVPDISNFQNYNVVPVNEQKFVNNAFSVNNNFPANTIVSNTDRRLGNVIINGMPLSNGGNLNDILLANSGMTVNMPETYVQYSDDNGLTDNDIQFGNVQVPDKKLHYEFVRTNMLGSHNLLPEGVQMFSNMPKNYLTYSISNNLNLAQELVRNLQIEGLGYMPFLNGLPVAGITETVTVLNSPYINECVQRA